MKLRTPTAEQFADLLLKAGRITSAGKESLALYLQTKDKRRLTKGLEVMGRQTQHRS